MKKLTISVIVAILIACFIEFLLVLGVTHFISWIICALIGIPFIGLKKVFIIAVVIMFWKSLYKGGE